MKRLIPFLLVLCTLFCGCQLNFGSKEEPVLFFYQQAEYQYGEESGAIRSEKRDGTNHITDIEYLLRLYLAGPHNEELVSPFPTNVQLNSVRSNQDMVTVHLTGTPDNLSDAQKTLAFACLTLTCLDISPVNSVKILWGDEIVTMDRSCLTLFDSTAVPTE